MQTSILSRAPSPAGPLQHLAVAVGVAERRERPLADEQVDPDGLAGPVVEKNTFGSRISTGLPSFSSYLVTMLEPTTCSGGMP